MLIAIEGIHGCGKSTLIEKIRENLQGKINITTTKWNSYPEIHPVIYDMRLNGDLKDPLVYTFMQLSDFAFRHENIIKKYLEKDYLVIADRYIHTGIARGVIRGIDENYMKNLYSFSRKADLTIILDINPNESIKRRRPSADKIWMIGMGNIKIEHEFDLDKYKKYLSNLRKMHLKLAKEDNAIIMNGLKEPNELAKEVLSLIKKIK